MEQMKRNSKLLNRLTDSIHLLADRTRENLTVNITHINHERNIIKCKVDI